LVGKSEVKEPHGRPTSSWKDNIRMHYRCEWEVFDCIHLSEDGDWWRTLV